MYLYFFHFKDQILKIISRIQKFVFYAEKLNIFGFYINGAYYHLSKRSTRIRYATVRTGTTNYAQDSEDKTIKRTFHVLGCLTFASLCVQSLSDFWKLYAQKHVPNRSESNSQTQDKLQIRTTRVVPQEVEVKFRLVLCCGQSDLNVSNVRALYLI